MLLVKLQTFQEGLERCAAQAVSALIGSFLIVVIYEAVQVGLDFFDSAVERFLKGHLAEFFLNDLSQPFHRSVSL